MSFSFSDPLPLRKTSDWGSYENIQPLQVAFGLVRAKAVPANAARTLWVFLDGVNGPVTAVSNDDNESVPFESLDGLDPAGRPVKYIETDPVDGELFVSGSGRLDEQTGEVQTSPADVIAHVYSLYGKPAPDLTDFRSECIRRGIEAHGVLAGSGASGRAELAQLGQSLGFIWSDGYEGLARIFPDELSNEFARVTIGASAADQVDCVYDVQDIYSRVLVNYAYDWAAAKHRRILPLEALGVVNVYGDRVLEIDGRWIASDRQAEARGRAQLEFSSRPQFSLSISTNSAVRAGDVAAISHPHSPFVGNMLLTSSRRNPQTGRINAQAQFAVGAVPVIEFTAISIAFDPDVTNGFEIQRGTNETRLGPVFDLETNEPLSGALAVLDGRGDTGRFTDESGFVIFPNALLPPGVHEILFSKEGFGEFPFQFEVSL